MMNKTILKIARIIIYILFVASVVYVGFVKIEPQDVTMIIDTNEEDVTKTFHVEDIVKDEFLVTVEAPDFDRSSLREIRLYRKFKTVCVDKIKADSFDYNAEVKNGVITFSDGVRAQLVKNSKSFFVERVMLAEVEFIIMIILLVILNVISEKLDPDNRSNHGPLQETKRFFGDIVKYWQYMNYAARADLKAEVANSYLNRLWWLLEPLFSMLVYVIVFGRVMGNSVENYATFVFSALLMWTYFSKTITFAVRCVRSNRDILTKVYVPKHVLLISNMILNMYKLVFSLIVLIPMLVIFRVHIGLNVFMVIPAYLLMIVLSFAGGMILLHYGVFVDDLGYAVGILLQMLMFLSGTFYDVITSLPVPLNNIMIGINPVALMIDTMRNSLLYNLTTNVPLIGLWFVIAILFSCVGVHIVYKNENGYAKVI